MDETWMLWEIYRESVCGGCPPRQALRRAVEAVQFWKDCVLEPEAEPEAGLEEEGQGPDIK